MNVYVLGAGVSKAAGYPLGSELLGDVDTCIRNLQSARHPQVAKPGGLENWTALCEQLARHPNPLVREAYRIKDFEFLFTILDSASAMQFNAVNRLAMEQGAGTPARQVSVTRPYQPFFEATLNDYTNQRTLLLRALGTYLHHKHHEDRLTFGQSGWPELQAFARKLRKGDVVITFNYDSTLERVLFRAGMWAPSDGYGFRVRLQRSRADPVPVSYGPSAVSTLHLHGAIGWRNKSSVEQFHIDEAVGRNPTLTPEVIEEPISLEEAFLDDLGIEGLDSDVLSGPYEFEAILHPSYLKAFGPPIIRPVFLKLWQTAAQKLREAGEIFIIGYSLPEADSAALALLRTSCDTQRVRIINSSKADANRLRRLLTADWLNHDASSLSEWLSKQTDLT
jgi:hypothetical protein